MDPFDYLFFNTGYVSNLIHDDDYKSILDDLKDFIKNSLMEVKLLFVQSGDEILKTSKDPLIDQLVNQLKTFYASNDVTLEGFCIKTSDVQDLFSIYKEIAEYDYCAGLHRIHKVLKVPGKEKITFVDYDTEAG